jgi:hypothetical protein
LRPISANTERGIAFGAVASGPADSLIGVRNLSRKDIWLIRRQPAAQDR